jgi:hypothetical protein
MSTCAQCGREVPATEKTCSHCATQLAVPVPASVSQFTPLLTAHTSGTPPAPAVRLLTEHVASSVAPVIAAPAVESARTAVSEPPALPAVVLETPEKLETLVPIATAPAAAKTARKGIDRRVLLAVVVVAMAGGTLTMALQMGGSAPTPVVVPKPQSPNRTPASTAGPVAGAAAPASAPTATAVAASTAAPLAAAPVAADVEASRWTQANREWLWNPKKGAAFQLTSVNKVAIWQGIAQPMLVVRCESNRLQAFVFTASAIQMESQDENHTVRLTIDDQPEQVERWADSDDHDALFAPDSLAFAHRLASARVVRIGYTPHNAARAVAEFHVQGLSGLLDPAAKSCGWKK